MTQTTDAALERPAALMRQAALIKAVVGAGGLARRAEMVKLGHSQRTIAVAISAGALRSIRRVWVAAPDADAYLVAAARSGVVLTCVTRARRLGLWIAGAEAESHVAASPHAGRIAVAKGTRVHRAQPLVPRPPGTLEDGIENTLANVCACQPFDTALAVVESALNRGLVDKQSLEGLALRSAARVVVEAATPFSDSGLETFIPVRLRWMGLRIVQQVWIAGHAVDFLIGERLVLQVDVGQQRAEDNRHDAILTMMGYHVIRVGYIQIMEDWPGVQQLVMQAVAHGLHREK